MLSRLPFFPIGVVFFALLHHFFTPRVWSQNERLGRESFLEQAPQAWEKFRARVKRFQGAVNTTKSMPDGRIVTHSHNEFKQGIGCALWLGQDLLKPPFRETDELSVANPLYGFELRRSSPVQPWVVTAIDLKPNRGSSSEMPFDVVEYFCDLPLSIFKEHLPDMLQAPEFTVKQVSPITRQGRRLVKVEFAYNRRDLSRKRFFWAKAGWILLDPEHYWVIREYDVAIDRYRGEDEQGFPGQVAGSYEYEDRNSFPILKRFVRKESYPQTSEGVQTESKFEIAEADVAESAFTLSAFGFPEPEGVKWPSRSSGWWLWSALIAAGIVSLALGRFLWRRKRSKQLAPSANT